MKLSVIILSFNTCNLTKKCLSSLFKYTPLFQFEVIAVDNGSKDNSVKIIKKNFPKVKLIVNTKNNGYAKANNQAVKVAKGKYVLLLNSDTEITKNTLQNMIGYLETHPSVGAVTAKLLNPDSSTQYYYHRKFPNFFSFVASVLEHYLKINTPLANNFFMRNQKFEKETEIDQAAGTVLLLKKDIIKNIGGLFDEHFPLFFNDTDLCLRIKKAKFKLILLPHVKVIHYRGQSTNLLNPYVLREELFVSMLYYFKKHKQFFSYILAKISLLILLSLLLLATIAGFYKNYLGTPIKSKNQSLINQLKILKTIFFEKRQISPFLN